MRANDNIDKALQAVSEVIDLTGDDGYEEGDVHAGAVVVTFDGFTRAVAVIDESGEGAEVDRDAAERVATEYMQYRSLIRPGQTASYVFVLEAEDAPEGMGEDLRDEIKDQIERYLDEHANQDAAMGHSTVDDQDLLDLEEYGYDADDPIKIAEFGYETAVGGDILFYRTEVLVGERESKSVQTWAESGHVGDLYRWMREQGYEKVDRLGGAWPGSVEIEIDADHLIDYIADQTEATEGQVAKVLEDEHGVSAGGQLYWGSGSGDIEMWAKPKPRVYLVIEFVRTDSDDYGHRYGAVVSAETQSEAEEAFASAVEGGDDAFWSREALDEGDTPERLEPYSTPLERQGWYMSWLDYDAALSPEEIREANETGEWPDIESSTELIQVQSVKVLDDEDSAQVSAEHLNVAWEHDVED
jgi:hypothetical protein